MRIISDIPTYLLEDNFKKKGINIKEIINFPNQIKDLDISNDEFLILIGDIFYKEFSKESKLENLKILSEEILNLLQKELIYLSNKNNIFFISLIPTHFLYSDKESYLFLKNESIDFFIQDLNLRLINIFRKNKNIYFLEGLGHIKENLSKDYFRYSSFFNRENSEIISNQLICKRNSLYTKKKKLIICDLDNTLWKGVIGDENNSSIKMDPSDPVGNIFHNVQKILLKFKESGFLFAICSKNEESIALNALFNNTSSLIKEKDIISYRINWNSKSENVKSICKELGLSLKETIFIDDSEYECDEVRKNCKGISIFKVPKNIYSYPYLLKSCNLFHNNINTIEDKNRTKLYKERIKRNNLLKNVIDSNLTKYSWIESLKTELIIEFVTEDSEYLDRIIQLFNRTNQFNLKGSKFTPQSFLKKLSENYIFYYGIAKDRIGNEGLISVVGIRNGEKFLHVSEFIVSCRIFGRFIEESMLTPVLKIAKKIDLGICFDQKNSDRNIISQKFISKICKKNTLFIPKESISSLINKYDKLPITLKINKEFSYFSDKIISKN